MGPWYHKQHMLLVIIDCLILVPLGLVMGSFAGAQVWRLRARQIVADKAAGEPYDKDELKRLLPLTKAKLTDDRSHCLRCQHVLRWYDLVPLVSWLSTRGRCRYCHKPIGRFEPIIEIGTAVIFGVFSYSWLHLFGLQLVGLVLLALWLAALTMLVILFAYDFKWFLLPDRVMFPLIGLSVIITGLMLKAVHTPSLSASLLSIGYSILILSGIYLALWLVSKGRWVGFGDVKLGLVLGILLADWRAALLTLFLANLIGTLIVLPGLIRGTLSRQTQIPFGPLLILGFFISLIFGHAIIDGYSSLSIWLSNILLML
jgi:prepilin signal peptidase PulO-like enzyme (type II secretory pathway)